MLAVLKKFAKPTAYELAKQELAESRRTLLYHQTHEGFHRNMALFYEQNVRRLEAYVAAKGEPNE